MMFGSVVTLARRHPIVLYFILAFAWSWSLGLLLIADYNALLSVPRWLHYLFSFGPGLAAIMVTALVGGAPRSAELWARITRWRIGWKWLLIVVGSPLLVAGVAILANYAMTGIWPDLATSGRVEYLGDIGVVAAVLLWLITFGFGEEIGWRGFAQERLEQQQHWLRASGLIGVVWLLWHVPSFFYKPQLMAIGLGGFAGFALGVLAGAVVFAWIYNGASHSIFAVAIWHGVFDFLITAEWAQGTIAAIESMLVMVWAVGIIAFVLWQQYRTPKSLLPKPVV
jgi:membrane protease YdiL (CAAX protease family)